MSLATLTGAKYHIGGNDILQGIDLTVTTDTRMGIVGPNGSGKTTMMRMIAGEIEPSEGNIFRLPKLRVGFLRQIKEATGSLRDVVMSGSPLWELKERLEDLEQRGDTGDEYIKLMGEWESRGGYELRRKSEEILSGLGFSEKVFDTPSAKLSGGERERAFIGRLLLTEPDLYLMDEPTNNLDYDGLVFLAEFLNKGKIPFIVISHDRYFLDMVTTETAVMERGRIRVFHGNFTDSIRERELLYSQMLKEWKAQQEEIKKEKDFIARNIAGQKTKQAQARRKKLDKMDILEKPLREQMLSFNIHADLRGGDDVLKLQGLRVDIKDRLLIEKTDKMLHRGDRIGIFGPNGSGKTTFFKSLIASYNRYRQGERDKDIRWGASIEMAYFEQGHDDIDSSKSPFDVIHDFRPAMTEYEIRSLLAVFGVRGDDVFRAVGKFSGGERTKLSLILMLLTGANLLLLDEPTNHLDIVAMAALEEALRQYDGTILIVSHDRYFLRNVVDKIWAIEDRKLHTYEGSIDYYLDKRESRKKPVVFPEKEGSAARVKPKNSKPSISKLRTMLEKLEKDIYNKEAELQKVSEIMGFPEVAGNAARCKALSDEHTKLEAELAELMDSWEECAYHIERSE